MKKFILLLALIAMICASLFACNSDDNNKDIAYVATDSATGSTEASSDTETQTDAQSNASNGSFGTSDGKYDNDGKWTPFV